jgi:lactoylglutathione lyase
LINSDPDLQGAGAVVGVWHAGITVSDIDRSLLFYRNLLGLEVIADRTVSEPYIFSIVGVESAAVRFAYLKVPGSDARVELVEYIGGTNATHIASANEAGTGHVCLTVENIDDLVDRMILAKLHPSESRPVGITSGPNKGARAIYVRDPDGYIVELFNAASRSMRRSRLAASHRQSISER